MMAGVVSCGPPSRFRADLQRPSPIFEISAGAWARSRIVPEADLSPTLCVEFFLSALDEALAMAGLRADSLRGRRIGVSVGTTVGCTLNDEEFYRAFKKGAEPGPEAIRRFLEYNPAPYISRALDLRGPVSTINNACASGTDAVGQASEWIEEGLCELVIAGGTDELYSVPYLGFSSLINT